MEEGTEGEGGLEAAAAAPRLEATCLKWMRRSSVSLGTTMWIK
jgi:hypothetical protein